MTNILTPQDCDLQRICHRQNPSEELKTYRLLTLTYGTKPASFLATRYLKEVVKDANVQTARRAIEENFYVDDLIAKSSTIEKAFSLYQTVSDVLNNAQLPLKKWCSYSKELMKQIPAAHEDPNYLLALNDNKTVSALVLIGNHLMIFFDFLLNLGNHHSK